MQLTLPKEPWSSTHEAIGNHLPSRLRNLGNLSMHFAIGPIGSCRVSPIAVDLQTTVFDNSQLVGLIRQLGIGLIVDQRLSDQEASTLGDRNVVYS
jgi:hypothetical protein